MQSFDPASLKYLRSRNLKAKMVRLMVGNGIDFRTGATIYNTRQVSTFASGRPYSWTLAGDPLYFDAMFTSAGLAEIKTCADGISPWKSQRLSLRILP